MTGEEAIKILKENLSIMGDALYWLNRSYSMCSKIGVKENYNETEFGNLEFTPRLIGICNNISDYCNKYSGDKP